MILMNLQMMTIHIATINGIVFNLTSLMMIIMI